MMVTLYTNEVILLLYLQEKPYVCDICSHPFHQKPNLDRHRATVHSEVSPFRCDECGLTFPRRSALKSHVVSAHDRSRRYDCSVCRTLCRNSRELNEHMASMHPHNRPGSSSRRGWRTATYLNGFDVLECVKFWPCIFTELKHSILIFRFPSMLSEDRKCLIPSLTNRINHISSIIATVVSLHRWHNILFLINNGPSSNPHREEELSLEYWTR